MFIQSLGSNGFLSLIYSVIANSITLAHPECPISRPHGGLWMITKFTPKDQGGRRCGYSKQRNEAIDSPYLVVSLHVMGRVIDRNNR